MIRPESLELITGENIHELEPGDWIWDDGLRTRSAHERSLTWHNIEETIGFRQIHILDLDFPYGLRYSKPWMLSDIDSYNGGYAWEIFDYNRFYKFKKEKKNDQT